MFRRLRQCALLVVPLLFAMEGPAAGASDDAPIPKATTERFLRTVPDFAGGTPSPSIIYSTRAVGEAKNSPEALRQAPPVTVIPKPTANAPLSSSRLQGGTLERREVPKQPIQKEPVKRESIQPYDLKSPWQ